MNRSGSIPVSGSFLYGYFCGKTAKPNCKYRAYVSRSRKRGPNTSIGSSPMALRVTEMQQLLGIHPRAALRVLENAPNGDNR